jgi:hypothetical protein
MTTALCAKGPKVGSCLFKNPTLGRKTEVFSGIFFVADKPQLWVILIMGLKNYYFFVADRKASLWAKNCPNFSFFLFVPGNLNYYTPQGVGKTTTRETFFRESFFQENLERTGIKKMFQLFPLWYKMSEVF